MKRLLHHVRTLLLLAGAVAMLYPLFWTVAGSLKGSNQEVFSEPFGLPHQLNIDNYEKALVQGRMGTALVNSVWVTGLSAVLTVVLALWAGYPLSRAGFPAPTLWRGALVLGMILPVQAYLFPLATVLEWFRLDDSLWSLVVCYTGQTFPVATLLFAAFLSSLPEELREAALLDGAGTARFYLQVLLPVSKPVVSTVVVLTLLNAWNDFQAAMLLVSDPARRTLPVSMIAFEQAHNTNYPALLAGLSLIALPTLLLYALCNRQVIQGVTSGSVR